MLLELLAVQITSKLITFFSILFIGLCHNWYKKKSDKSISFGFFDLISKIIML